MSEEVLNKILVKVFEIEERMATKQELATMRSDIITTIDRFAKLHETLDQELVAVRNRCDRLEDRLVFVERKLGISTT